MRVLRATADTTFSPDAAPFFADSDRTVAWLRPKGITATVIPAGELPATGTLVLGPASALETLVEVIDRLLSPDGCPWDRAQTHESLKPYLLEEAYEVMDAIDRKDDDGLREELGDVLLQPVLHAQIRAAAGGWDTESVARTLVEKLIRRHPHVFGTPESLGSAEAVRTQWEAIKRAEKADAPPSSVLDGVLASLPALMRAQKVSQRAAKTGFEWPDLDGVLDKLREEIDEFRTAETADERRDELGDILFTLVNVARWQGIDAEDALRQMVDRFERRFRTMEALAERPLAELSPADWDRLWESAKSRERSA
ncbi:MAG: nucleoside triphosphate pyrophosphohydrolase [Fimbriimonadaceae bacterium]|nr:nucleoside triphosphate pyrophosphohydrolase [Fimbriimonadaceae bacterium]